MKDRLKKKPNKTAEKRLKVKTTLVDFFKRSPYPNLELDLSRDKDTGREIIY